MWTQEELETKTKEELIEIILESQKEAEDLIEVIDTLKRWVQNRQMGYTINIHFLNKSIINN